MQLEAKARRSDVPESAATDHLAEVLSSRAFAASRRCQQFLSFVVHETLEGRADTLKERTIATEVFGKDHRFEPGEDSLVRVKAREVRKRLAEFYDQHPDSAVRIELPLGGYVPRFHQAERERPEAEPVVTPAAITPPVEAPERKRFSRRSLTGMGVACAAAAAAWPVFKLASSASTPLDQLWKPIFATGTPMLIAIPLLTSENGSVTERVGLGAAAAANEAAEFFVSRRYPYRLRFGADFTFSQLREQPSLLLGGFSSVWTTRITSGLRFFLVPNHDGAPGGSIHDAQTGKEYGPILTTNGYASEDYALVCRLFDAAAGQIILIAAGITTFGTESAARFFFRPDLFPQLVRGQEAAGWQRRNLQAVIRVSVIGTTPSVPTVVATHFW